MTQKQVNFQKQQVIDAFVGGLIGGSLAFSIILAIDFLVSLSQNIDIDDAYNIGILTGAFIAVVFSWLVKKLKK